MALVDPPWFVKRRFGWGLSPGTWQGWTVTAIFVVAYAVAGVGLMDVPSALLVTMVALLAAFLLLVVVTGERPGHRTPHR